MISSISIIRAKENFKSIIKEYYLEDIWLNLSVDGDKRKFNFTLVKESNEGINIATIIERIKDFLMPQLNEEIIGELQHSLANVQGISVLSINSNFPLERQIKPNAYVKYKKIEKEKGQPTNKKPRVTETSSSQSSTHEQLYKLMTKLVGPYEVFENPTNPTNEALVSNANANVNSPISLTSPIVNVNSNDFINEIATILKDYTTATHALLTTGLAMNATDNLNQLVEHMALQNILTKLHLGQTIDTHEYSKLENTHPDFCNKYSDQLMPSVEINLNQLPGVNLLDIPNFTL